MSAGRRTGRPWTWMTLSEPCPSICIATPCRWKTSFILSRRRSPRALRLSAASGGVNLAKCHYASSHRERVVVVRARVDEGVGLGRVEAAHDCVSSAERPEGETAAEIFPEASHVGEDAELLLKTSGRQARGHHLVKNEDDPVPPRFLTQHCEELAVGGDSAS